MAEHIQTPTPKERPKSEKLKQLQDALAAAESFRKIIRANNTLALKNQDRIIAEWKRQIAALTGDSWLT